MVLSPRVTDALHVLNLFEGKSNAIGRELDKSSYTVSCRV